METIIVHQILSDDFHKIIVEKYIDYGGIVLSTKGSNFYNKCQRCSVGNMTYVSLRVLETSNGILYSVEKDAYVSVRNVYIDMQKYFEYVVGDKKIPQTMMKLFNSVFVMDICGKIMPQFTLSIWMKNEIRDDLVTTGIISQGFEIPSDFIDVI